MVDFRYHIVSIVAVFLALGIGIVVGTTTLDQALIGDLKGNVKRLSADKRDRDSRIHALEQVVADDREFGQALVPLLIGGQLRGRHVVVVSAPGVDKGMRDGLLATLDVADATITGRVRLADALGKPERAAELDDLVDRLLPPGVQLSGATPVERAAKELAAVIGVRATGAPAPTTPPRATTQVLSGLTENGYLAVDGPVTSVVPAPLVLVVVPGEVRRTPTPSPTAAAPDPVLALVRALTTEAQGVVVVSAAADSGTMLAAIRTDAALAGRLSTVDSAGGVQGRVAAVLALGNELVGEHGDYGTGSGVDAPVPSPLPAAKP